MNLDELQSAVDAWIGRAGGYFGILTNLARLQEEAGELAHILARTDGELPTRPGQRVDRVSLEKEFGDLLFVTAVLANQKGIRLAEAIGRVLDDRAGRPSPQ